MAIDAVVHAMPWAEMVLKVTAFLGAAWVAAVCLRRGSAAMRHGVWAAALAVSLVLPWVGWVVPTGSGWRVLPEWTGSAEAGTVAEPAETALAIVKTTRVTPANAGVPVVGDSRKEGAEAISVALPAAVSGAPVGTAFHMPNFLTMVVIVWAAGVGVGIAWLVWASFLLGRVLRESRRVEDGGWVGMLEELRGELGIRRRVRLFCSKRHAIPMTFGWSAPVIVVPAAAMGWGVERRRMVLLHELAHVRRLDGVTLLMARVACAVYWFHPLAWYAGRRLRIESERACDDLVLTRGAGIRSSDYAAALVEVAFHFGESAKIPRGVMSMARMSTLEDRVRRVLSRERNRRPVAQLTAAAMAVVVLGIVVPLAMLQAQAIAPAGFAFTGIVVDEKGAPVAHVQVQHHFIQGETYTAQTEDSGKFTMYMATENSHYRDYVAATPDGGRMGFAIYAKSGQPELRITLRPARELAVLVTNDKQQPIADALVAACSGFTEIGALTTNAKGEAKVHIPADAPVTDVVATKRGMGTDYFKFAAKNGVRNEARQLDPDFSGPFKFVLNGAKRGTIRVVDEQQQPIAGAHVSPWYFEKPDKGGELNVGLEAFAGVTDAQGQVICDMIPSDTVRQITFWVEKKGYTSPGRWLLDVTGNEDSSVTATLLKKVTIKGHVVDEQGQPADGANVMVAGAGYQIDSFEEHFKTEADGTFAHEIAADMYYAVIAQRDHNMSPVVTQVIRRATPAPIELQLEAGRQILGTVTGGPKDAAVVNPYVQSILQVEMDYNDYDRLPEAQKLPNPTGSKSSLSPSIMLPVMVSPNSNTFELYVTPGKYLLMCDSVNDSVNKMVTINNEMKKEVSLHLALAPDALKEIHGRVVFADKPGMGAADVVLESTYVKEPPSNRRSPWGTSDKAGNFALMRSAADFYLMGVTKDGKYGAIQVVKSDDEGITLPLRATAQVKGTLVDAQGKNIAGQKLEWGIEIITTGEPMRIGNRTQSRQFISYQFGGSTTAGSDGTFTLGGLLVGSKYVIHAPDVQDPNSLGPTICILTPETAETKDLGNIPVRPTRQAAPNPENPELP